MALLQQLLSARASHGIRRIILSSGLLLTSGLLAAAFLYPSISVRQTPGTEDGPFGVAFFTDSLLDGCYGVFACTLGLVVPGLFVLWLVPQGLSIPRHDLLVSGLGHFSRERWAMFFVLGAVGAVLVLVVEQLILSAAGVRDEDEVQTIGAELLKAFVVAAVCEEGFKCFMAGQAARSVSHRILRRDEWGVEWVATSTSYSIAAALGLAATETALVVMPEIFYGSARGAISKAFTRAIVTAPLHATTGAYLGAYAAEMATTWRADVGTWAWSLARQMVVPVLLHGSYDLAHTAAVAFPSMQIGQQFAWLAPILGLTINAASALLTRRRLKRAYEAAARSKAFVRRRAALKTHKS